VKGTAAVRRVKTESQMLSLRVGKRIEQRLRQTEKVPRVFDCHGVNVGDGYTDLFKIGNQLARSEQNPIGGINCVPPLLRVLWNQRAPELRILREKDFVCEASVDE
jgi:hypothetical protein